MPILITKIVVCPYCRARVNLYTRKCSHCNEDLSLLRDLHLLPYALYNQGVERFTQGDYGGALLKVSAALELSRGFDEAQLLLAKIANVLGLKDLNRNGHKLPQHETSETPGGAD